MFKSEADYVTRGFNPESIRGWDAALRDFQLNWSPESAEARRLLGRSLAEGGSWFRAELDCS
jgi:hypothetical protein